MKEHYDTILLLTENLSQGDDYLSPITQMALQRYKQGLAGSIYISGGNSGLSNITLKTPQTDGDLTKKFLIDQGVKQENIYLDTRPREAIGKCSFLVADPLKNNPNLLDMKRIYMPIRKGYEHIAHDSLLLSDLAGRVVMGSITDDYSLLPNKIKQRIPPLKEGPSQRFYQKMLIHTMNKLNPGSPQQIHRFLLKHHPFYSKDWFKKSQKRRKLEAMLAFASLPFYSYK